jgi:hypothetical protein
VDRGCRGRGFGGALLMMITELAWTLTPTGPSLGMRVWVKTSSNDHPHARPNYESRGFRIFAEQSGRSAMMFRDANDQPRLLGNSHLGERLANRDPTQRDGMASAGSPRTSVQPPSLSGLLPGPEIHPARLDR